MSGSCNLCGKNDFRVLHFAGRHRVVKCRNCGLIFVDPMLESEKLVDHYDQEYYAPWLEDNAVREEMWKRRFKKVQAFKLAGKLLDVGCGTGNFLNIAKNNGWEAYGTEVSGYAVDYAKNNYGVKIFRGELRNADFSDDFFDVITLWHVLEHTVDPLGNLVEAGRILKPGGVLILAVPNVRNYIYKIAYTLVKLKTPELFSLADRELHLYHFSARTLKEMIDKAGLNVVKLGMDKERILVRERIVDNFAWIIYKVLGVNFGMALEAYAQKS